MPHETADVENLTDVVHDAERGDAMGSRKDKNMALKTRKARMLAAQEAAVIQGHGDAADYQRGYRVRVIDSRSGYQARADRARWEAWHDTPLEDRMYSTRETVDVRVPKRGIKFCAVYMRDGTATHVRGIEAARGLIASGQAVKIWNPERQWYEYADYENSYHGFDVGTDESINFEKLVRVMKYAYTKITSDGLDLYEVQVPREDVAKWRRSV